MAYINRLPKAKRTNYNENENHKIYNCQTWRNTRKNYIEQHPFCERHLKLNKYRNAVDVHHIIRFSEGATFEEKQAIAYDPNNLESLCKECHKLEHSKNKN